MWEVISSKLRTTSFLLCLFLILTTILCVFSDWTVAQPDIVVDITGFPSSLEPGDLITYTIYFNNTGPDSSPVVWVNLTMPSHLTYWNDSSAIEGGMKTGDYNWTFQPVLVGDHSFYVMAELGSDINDMESILSEVYLDYKDNASASMPPSWDSHTSFGKIPQIDPIILSSSPVLDPGDMLNITIYFNNTGSAVADSLFVNVSLPSEINYLSDDSASEGGTKIGDYNWSFFSVALGGHHFNITTVLEAGLDNGTSLEIGATATFSNTNEIWFQERVTDATVLVVAPMIEVGKSSNTSLASPGETVNFTIDLRNIGGGSSRDVWINDTLPWNLTFIDSFPDYESITGRTYSFHFTSFLPGSEQISVIVEVNDSAPAGVNLTNFVTVEYTDANGNPLGGKQAQVNISVERLKMSFEMRLPLTETTPLDVIDVGMRFQNVMTCPSMFTWINLTIPGQLGYLSDTSSLEGGAMSEVGKWVFTNVSEGNHSFDVFLQVNNRSEDGLLLPLMASMTFTNRFGAVVSIVEDVEYLTVHRPEIDFAIHPRNVTARRGETFELSFFFNNTGSRDSQYVWINATLPSGVQILSETSLVERGVREGTNFTFEGMGPGEHAFEIIFLIENRSEYANLSFKFEYLDSDGDFLSTAIVRVKIQLLGAEVSGFPMSFLIALAAALASASLVLLLRFEESFRLKFLSLFIPLYSRLRREEVLDNETRGMIRGYIIANPGDHFTAIGKALDLKNGTLAYHLTVLEKERIVKSVRDGKFRRFFPSEMKVPKASFPTRIEEMILEVVRETPGITLKDIASSLAISSPTASYHVGKLKEMNLVRRERRGISIGHYLHDTP